MGKGGRRGRRAVLRCVYPGVLGRAEVTCGCGQECCQASSREETCRDPHQYPAIVGPLLESSGSANETFGQYLAVRCLCEECAPRSICVKRLQQAPAGLGNTGLRSTRPELARGLLD